MSDKTYPKLSIRVSAELKAACDRVGAERVRELLSVLLSDKELSDKPIVPQKRECKLSDKPEAEQPIVGQTEAKPVPAWKAKLDAGLAARLGRPEDGIDPKYVERLQNDPTLNRAAQRKYGANH